MTELAAQFAILPKREEAPNDSVNLIEMLTAISTERRGITGWKAFIQNCSQNPPFCVLCVFVYARFAAAVRSNVHTQQGGFCLCFGAFPPARITNALVFNSAAESRKAPCFRNASQYMTGRNLSGKNPRQIQDGITRRFASHWMPGLEPIQKPKPKESDPLWRDPESKTI
ncbi:MAG: hypothetical protein LBG12_04160 [Synergistaceae bacterium]|jgi:hypothetical protein|nr:hypothetical protein [Synergistaceae bacterium]